MFAWTSNNNNNSNDSNAVVDTINVNTIQPQPMSSLETDRLLLRSWKREDYPIFATMSADPDVMKYYPAPLSQEESNALADKIVDLMKSRSSDGDWGFWAVELKESSEFIGFVGLHEPEYELPVKNLTEVGWRLAKPHWHKGYATEAAKLCLRFAFERLDRPEIYAFTSVTNASSRAVMERLQMKNTNQNFLHPHIPQGHALEEHVLYKITRKEWQEHQQ